MLKSINKVKTFGRFTEVPPSAIKPQGFIKEFLLRQKSGLTGNFKVQNYPFDTVMWAGKISNVGFRDFEYNGRVIKVEPINAWWPYEQTAYLLDGALKLAYLIEDEELRTLFEENLNYLVSNPDDSGHMGMKAYNHNSEWPMAVFFKAVMAYCAETGDTRIIDAFHKHYMSLSVDDLAIPLRHINNLEGMVYLYSWTGDKALLDKAIAAYDKHNEYNDRRDCYEEELWFNKIKENNHMVMHGVSFSESIKLPVLLYIATGDDKYLAPAKACMERVFAEHGQPTGMPSANEYLSGRDPLQGYETCVITDLTWSLGYFIMADGNVDFADRMEKIVYNALEGSITKDFANLQYLSGVNQVLATPFSNNSHFLRGYSAWRQYRNNHFPECCGGNVHRTMPNFAIRMWMQDSAGAPVATFYGPSTFSWEFDGAELSVTEDTLYPFDGKIDFKFAMNKSVNMPFTFRIPTWCTEATATINGQAVDVELATGSFATIVREWSDGDVLSVVLPMAVTLHQDRQWQWLERGPVTFAYAIPYTETLESDDKFASRTFMPAGDWNYALDITPDTLDKIKVVFNGDNGYAYDKPMIELQVPARRISNYSLDCNRYTPQVPIYFETSDSVETISLVPFGTTITRITAFPIITKREMIPVVSVTAAGPYPYNRRLPLAEQWYEPEFWGGYEFIDTTRSYVLPSEGEYYDLIRHFKASEDVLGYMNFRIWAETAGEAILTIGASDGCIGWMNGEKILEIEPIHSGEFMEPFWFKTNLQQGYNFLRLKVCDFKSPGQYRQSWGAKVQLFREV